MTLPYVGVVAHSSCAICLTQLISFCGCRCTASWALRSGSICQQDSTQKSWNSWRPNLLRSRGLPPPPGGPAGPPPPGPPSEAAAGTPRHRGRPRRPCRPLPDGCLRCAAIPHHPFSFPLNCPLAIKRCDRMQGLVRCTGDMERDYKGVPL